MCTPSFRHSRADGWYAAPVRGFPLDGDRRAEPYTFPADLALDHDVIDPNHPEQRVELVYPVLIDLIAGKNP